MLKIIKYFFVLVFHFVVIVLLTIISQVGGLIWFLVFVAFLMFRRKTPFFIKLTSFLGIYLLSVLFVVPNLALINGRKQLPSSKNGIIMPHNPIYFFLNRNYVSTDLFDILFEAGNSLHNQDKNIKLVYLDASFPFFEGFPLFPHFSHNDGKKIDLCYAYRKNGSLVNHGSSFSGYGNFIEPLSGEINQTEICKSNGNVQYDFSKYISIKDYDDYIFDMETSKMIIETLLKSPRARSMFIEPNLKARMHLNDDRIRFAGCHAVRHDDHFHFQIR